MFGGDHVLQRKARIHIKPTLLNVFIVQSWIVRYTLNSIYLKSEVGICIFKFDITKCCKLVQIGWYRNGLNFNYLLCFVVHSYFTSENNIYSTSKKRMQPFFPRAYNFRPHLKRIDNKTKRVNNQSSSLRFISLSLFYFFFIFMLSI